MDIDTEIAIVGMACRLPGDAASLESFWKLLIQGRSSWSDVPPERWNARAYHHPSGERKGTTSIRGGHFLNGNIARFDAPFFAITPSEAKTMDPQQRMLLEVTYEAFENAGIRIEDLAGSKTSCFVGDFSSRDYETNMNKDTENSTMHQLSGNTMSIMSNRLSYFFNLHGPSMTVDTACSSGLVALHLGCQSIKSGESNMAIVAGVNLMQSPDMTIALDALHLLSPDGKSYAFDSRANGYGRGEGFAVVILKPQLAAIRGNDTVRATIRGSGCNHDGKTKGLHLPSAEAQEALIRETYASAGLEMKDTAYCEAHGTGTAAGDPLEAKALAATLGKARESTSPLMIGTVKTNIGHLEGAAGLASVIKTVLALERGIIPPSINFKTPTPRIPFASNNLEVVTEPKEWPESVRRASINSFGFGGTNSHVILEGVHPPHIRANGYAEHNLPDWIEVVANGNTGSTAAKQPKLFCWSARDEKGIARLCESYARYLSTIEDHRTSTDGDKSLTDDLWYTLTHRRSTLDWKSWCLASTIDELNEKLLNGISRPIRSSKAPQVAFVFTGQGAQWHAMGRELMAYKVYRESIQQADAYLASTGCSWSVIDELNHDASSSRVNDAIYSQPLCTVIQVALVQLLRSWNIQPRAVVGHSSGEIAAAYCIGALSSQSAWKLAYQRGQLSRLLQAGSGAMMSVGLGADEANRYIDSTAQGKAVVACINSPASVTLSGDVCALDQLDKVFKAEGIFARKLKVEVAYHSHHMKAVATAYLESIKDVIPQPSSADPEVKMFSSVTGDVMDTSVLTPEYWVANLVSPVRFADTVLSLSTYHPGKRRRHPVGERFVDQWLEIGPHGALASPVKQTLDQNTTEYLSILQRGKDAISTALAVTGELWSRGYTVDLASTNNRNETKSDQPCLLVDAPTYPWNHSAEYWSEPRLSIAHRFRKHPRQDLLGSPVEGSNEPAWRHFLRMSENPWMEDNQIRLEITYCSAGLMTMAVEGAKQLAEDKGLQIIGYELQDVHFQQLLMIPPEEEGVEVLMQFRSLALDASDSGLIVHTFVIDSLAPGQNEWRRNCAGRVLTHIHVQKDVMSRSDLYYGDRYESIVAACRHDVKPEAFYLELTGVGMAFGITFRNLVQISSSDGEASCGIRVPDTAANMPENLEYPHAIHPALLESMTHVMIPALTGPKTALKETLVPQFVDSVYISNDITGKPGDELKAYATAKWHNSSLAEGDIVALDSQKNQPVVIITKMQYKVLPTWDVGANEWQPTVETSTKYRKLCSQIKWKIDQGSFRHNETVDLPFYFECLFHKNPALKVLQVGGDPADVTGTLLRVATADSGHPPLFSSLLYTAGSARAIADAGVVLAQWSTHVQFEILNIEEDLIEQGFEPGTIDLVIANFTQQSPGRMNHFLSQLRVLMKPKGTLLIEGDIKKLADVESVTSGSTNSNHGISMVHSVSLEPWKMVMMEHGFISGPTLCKDSGQREVGSTKLVLAATAVSDSATSPNNDQALIIRPINASQNLSTLMTNVVGRLSALGFNTVVVDIYTAIERTLEACLVINMVEIEELLLSRTGLADFEAFKSLVLRSKYLLWMTMGGVMTGNSPEMSMASGFARTMRHETDSPDFATLDLDSVSQLNQTSTYNEIADAVGTVALLLCEEAAGPSFEREFAYYDGHLYVPRISPLEDLNSWMNEPDGKLRPEMVCLDQIDCPVQAAWRTEGDVEGLYFKEDLAALDPIGDNHVRIDVKASALNMADRSSRTEKMGLECAGVITEFGKHVRHLRKGDRVMTIGPGCHRTTVTMTEDLCQRIPESLSFQQGASIPLAYCTAYLALFTTARLKKCESILIHDSPDGIDQAAVEIALYLGAEVFVLTDSVEKQATMTEKFHIAESHILAVDNLELSRSLMRLTNDKGINVIVGNSKGEIMRQSWRCIANFGRFVNLNIRDGLEYATELDMRPFKGSATYSSIDVMDLLEHRPDEVSRIFRDVRYLLDQGDIRPISPIASYSYSRILEYFSTPYPESMQGKTVLSAQDQDVVPFVRAASKPFGLNSDSSYLLPGGLGGLGRSIAQWLIKHGARSLIFLSRSGAHSPDAASFVADLQSQGIQVGVYQCDISNLCHLKETLASCASDFPPIRGVVQCAMNLHDAAFENMTADDWQAVIAPKVQGSWNLHSCLPSDMDFFIMLASFVGITGNRGQANYAAANAYQDALALHRRTRGLAATSIDLGWMHDIGVVADKWEQMFKLRNSGFEGMREHELHIVLEAAITGKVPQPGPEGTSSVPSQIITGVATGGMIERSGARDFGWMNDAKFSYLKTVDSREMKEARATTGGGGEASQLKRRLREATTKSDAVATVKEALMAKLVQSTGLDVRDVDEEKPVHALGLDSLVAIEIRGWAKRELKAEVSGVFILSNTSIKEVAATMAEGSELVDKAIWV